MKRVVVKIGSLVIENKNGLLVDKIENLCSFLVKLRESYEVILVTSGAVGAGSEKLKLDRTILTNRQAMSAVGQPYLMRVYAQILDSYGVNSSQLLLTEDDFDSIKSTKNAKVAIDTLLHNGVLPILNENDVTATSELNFGDNDKLSANATCYFDAQMLILLSDLSSYKNKKIIRDLKEEDLEIESVIDPTSSSGGLITKLEAAKFVLLHNKCMYMASGVDLSDVYSFMIEKDHQGGTLFCKENI